MRKLFGHPIHPALSDYPIALLPTAFLCDVFGYAGKQTGWVVGYWCELAGLVMAVPTALFGIFELLAIPKEKRRAADLALWHLAAAATALLLFFSALALRPSEQPPRPDRSLLVLGFELAGVVAILVAGWLGGHLVFSHGVGVRDDRR